MSDGLKLKYFVLNPGKQDAYGEASRAAMREYARVIEQVNDTLAWELEKWAYEAGGIGFSDEERAAADVYRAKAAPPTTYVAHCPDDADWQAKRGDYAPPTTEGE